MAFPKTPRSSSSTDAAAPRIVLASGSPRRKSLLAAAGFSVTVRVPNADEMWPGGNCDAASAAMTLARRKLATVGRLDPTLVTVAADTLVMLGDTPLDKPPDRETAAATLRRLSGAVHHVVTGFVVAKGDVVHAEAVTTRVCFRELTDAAIARYLDTGESFDKAGAYGIQGVGGSLVDWVDGSYTNVVGLPLTQVLRAVDALQVAAA